MSGGGGNPRRALPRNVAVQIFRAMLEKRRVRAGQPHDRDGQRHPQRRRHDPAPLDPVQPHRQAAITTELVEIISGAEAL
jgi:F-type H+-transporting ATPase subunit gamma